MYFFRIATEPDEHVRAETASLQDLHTLMVNADLQLSVRFNARPHHTRSLSNKTGSTIASYNRPPSHSSIITQPSASAHATTRPASYDHGSISHFAPLTAQHNSQHAGSSTIRTTTTSPSFLPVSSSSEHNDHRFRYHWRGSTVVEHVITRQ